MLGEILNMENQVSEHEKQILRDWLDFSSDVQPGCAAGAEWLESLRARTSAALDPGPEARGETPLFGEI